MNPSGANTKQARALQDCRAFQLTSALQRTRRVTALTDHRPASRPLPQSFTAPLAIGPGAGLRRLPAPLRGSNPARLATVSHDRMDRMPDWRRMVDTQY